jgi:hypothetical protein
MTVQEIADKCGIKRIGLLKWEINSVIRFYLFGALKPREGTLDLAVGGIEGSNRVGFVLCRSLLLLAWWTGSAQSCRM